MKQLLPNMTALLPILNLFQSCLSKPQFKHFHDYIGGLLTLSNKSMSGICDALVEKRHTSSMSRFLSSLAWDENGLIVKYLRKIRFVFSREWVSVIIDDTLSEKTGKNIDGVQFHKDHAGGGFVFGHQFVTALLRSRDIILPLVPRFYSKKTASKSRLHTILSYLR